MKLNPISWFLRDEGDLIAWFGNARLVKRLNGKFELLGGTDADRAEAKEWCSLFPHEAVFVSSPPRGNRPTVFSRQTGLPVGQN